MFPRLKERQHTEAGVLSGGEQQMLTLCRTLMGDPDLIMIDEPTEGLAPKIVELVAEYLKELQAPRPVGAAGRAEADHRAGHLRALLRDGPRQHRLRRHARPSCVPTPTSARSGWRSDGVGIEEDWLRRIGPAHFSHINFRGTFRFNVERYADVLVEGTAGLGAARPGR
jgi:hypothetical protein